VVRPQFPPSFRQFPEVLDHIIRSNESLRTAAVEPRHYLLYAHRSTESVQTKFIEHFFRDQCGVRVIPYCIDAKGYTEVVELIKAWSSELDVRDPTTLDLQTHLDRYVASPSAMYSILVRVGIFVCGEHYGNVGAVFWDCAKQNWFVDAPYSHEIYWFTKKAFAKFSSGDRSKFLDFVNRAKGDFSDESRQQEWDESHRPRLWPFWQFPRELTA
jgi:hypothetical protein